MAKLKTGRHTSSIKEARKAEKRNKRNMAIKSKIKTSIKRIKTAISNDTTEVSQEQLLRQAFSELDKAAKKHILHFKTASNKKAKLSRLVAKNNKSKD
ncbi:MAG: 30S ribosomal protein S20 [Endomicrobium sp.]|jgi:small subunit ribosomal protein S20|nr:30S ribosomal protein S20 [Endomicrobium sp.]